MKKITISPKHHESLGKAKKFLTIIIMAVVLFVILYVSDKVLSYLFPSRFTRRIIFSIFVPVTLISLLMYLAIILDMIVDMDTNHCINWFNYKITDIINLIRKTALCLFQGCWNPNTMTVPCLLFIGTFYTTSFAADFIISNGMWALDSLYNLCPTVAFSILCLVLMLGIILFSLVIMFTTATYVFYKSMKYFDKK